MKERRKQKQKTQIRVSGYGYACAYIGLHKLVICVRIPFVFMHMH